MKKLKLKDKVFFILMLIMSLNFSVNLFIRLFQVAIGDRIFSIDKISFFGLYMVVSFIYLFNIVFLKNIKNVEFWKIFFYVGILLLTENFVRSYGFIATYKEMGMAKVLPGLLLITMAHVLFLIANYEYVFKLKNITEK